MLYEAYPIYIFIVISFIHWFADFFAQSHWMASNKSKSNKALALHILAYTSILTLAFGPIYGVVNGLLHWVTDYFTSRATSKLHAKGDIHNFFVVIGADQFLHMAALFLTIPLICWV